LLVEEIVDRKRGEWKSFLEMFNKSNEESEVGDKENA